MGKCKTTMSNVPGNLSLDIEERAKGIERHHAVPINAEWFRPDVPVLMSPEYRQSVDYLKSIRFHSLVVNDLMVEYIRFLSQLQACLKAQLDMASILEHKLLAVLHTLLFALVNLFLGFALSIVHFQRVEHHHLVQHHHHVNSTFASTHAVNSSTETGLP